MTVKILIVDDHPLVRTSLASLVRVEDDFEVVGEAEDGESAIEIAESLHPDVVLMDYNMPGMTGAEATQEIARLSPESRVIGFSNHDEIFVQRRMLAAGARAFFLKGGDARKLLKMIHEIAEDADLEEGK